MKIITDSFFQQGVTHEVCEDYALHGDNFGVIADGCSNGTGPSINSDWGARLLCKATEASVALLSSWTQREFLFGHIFDLAKKNINKIGNLQQDCLSATIGIVYLNNVWLKTISCNIKAILMGDGAILAQKHTGEWLIKIYEPIKGGPFYLKYMAMNEQDKYYEQFGGEYRITTYSGDIKNPEVLSASNKEIVLDKVCPWFEEEFPVSDYKSVFVCTDGINSFYRKENTGTSKQNIPVPTINVLNVILDDINYRSGFLRLQRNWAFKRNVKGTFSQKQWYNADDVSFAGLHVMEGG